MVRRDNSTLERHAVAEAKHPNHVKRADALGAAKAVAELTTLLEQVIRGRSCVLVDWPAYPNVGDHLIWLGQKVMLKSLLGVKVVYQCAYDDVDFDRIATLRNSVILCSGGGNFGDIYYHHQKFREDLAARFSDRDVVFLPQTIHYQDESVFRDSRQTLSSLDNLTIFARDLGSYRTAAAMTGKQNVHLAIDSAFALQPLIPRLLSRLAAPKKQPLYLLRQDRESCVSLIDQPADALVVDWIAEDSLDWVMDEASTRATIEELRLHDLIDAEWELRSLELFVKAVCLFSRASYVVTDRLHAHILSLLMGIKCIVHDNSYGKNSAFSSAWTCDDPLVAFSDATKNSDAGLNLPRVVALSPDDDR